MFLEELKAEVGVGGMVPAAALAFASLLQQFGNPSNEACPMGWLALPFLVKFSQPDHLHTFTCARWGMGEAVKMRPGCSEDF